MRGTSKFNPDIFLATRLAESHEEHPDFVDYSSDAGTKAGLQVFIARMLRRG